MTNDEKILNIQEMGTEDIQKRIKEGCDTILILMRSGEDVREAWEYERVSKKITKCLQAGYEIFNGLKLSSFLLRTM